MQELHQAAFRDGISSEVKSMTSITEKQK